MSISRFVLLLLMAPLTAAAQTIAELPQIVTHDNLVPAGLLRDGVLRLSLWAGVGRWNPEGEHSSPLLMQAFGEEDEPLSIPSPLIRAPEGTEVHLSLRNSLKSPLSIYGLCPGSKACEPVIVPPGASRDLRFALNEPGTFHYRAATSSSSFALRDGEDSQLGGAIVVDPVAAGVRDRVFVMGLTTMEPVGAVRELTVINGRSWPYTERLQYETGDTARWRVINLTSEAHAMHLHGFYFHVGSVGDGLQDTWYGETEKRMAVTEVMLPGRTMTIDWVPERAGNWLFHCHMLVHMMDHVHADSGHGPDSAAAGMAGLVLGVRVTGADRIVETADVPRRPLKLFVRPDSRHGDTPSYRVDLVTGGQPPPRLSERAVPGPVMVLTRGEPVAVEIVNALQEPTAIHWHGIELESFNDGVPGFGGVAGNVTPPVEAGGTFTAHFTPQRAGTFIYHTHWHNAAQLTGGIYGPLIVLEPGEIYDPVTDHIIVLGLDGANLAPPNEPFAVNGETRPRPLALKAGVPNRIRLINITANNVALTVQLLDRFDPIQWALVGKDGSETPPNQRTARPARQLVTVGETYDFELAPMPPISERLWMELRRGNGELIRQWPVTVQ